MGMPSSRPTDSDFKALLAEKVRTINEVLDRLIADQREIHEDLRKAIVYTLCAPGKRIRAALVLWCCELAAGRENANARMVSASRGRWRWSARR